MDQDSASRLSLCQGAKVSAWVRGRAAEVGLREPDSPSPPSPLLDSTGAFPSRMKTGCCVFLVTVVNEMLEADAGDQSETCIQTRSHTTTDRQTCMLELAQD